MVTISKYIYFSKSYNTTLWQLRQTQNTVAYVNVLGKRIKLSACTGDVV